MASFKEKTSSEHLAYISNRLLALGAPHVPLQELERLHKGSLGDALTFVVEHVRGRDGTKLARHRLYALQEGKAGPSIRIPEINLSLSELKKTRSRLIGAKNDVSDLQASYNARQKALDESQQKIAELNARLEEKRVVDLLLCVLYKKEFVRTQRLDRLAELLDELRKEVPNHRYKDFSLLISENENVSGEMLNVSCTRDTLAAFRAHHIRLSAIISHSRLETKHTTDTQLRHAIARIVDRPEDSDEVHSLFEKFVQSAKLQAVRRLRQSSVFSGVPDTRPEGLAEDIKTKQAKLQVLSDTAIALGDLSSRHLQSISTFDNVTSQTLRSSLEREAKEVRGYVDVLQWDITSRVHRSARDHALRTEVGTALGLRGNNISRDRLLAGIEDVVRDGYGLDSFRVNTSILPSAHATISATTDAELASNCEKEDKRIQDHGARLLSRKLEKAKKGDMLIEEVEKTIKEVGKVTALGR